MQTHHSHYVAESFQQLEQEYLVYETKQFQCFIVPGGKLGVILLELGKIRELALRTVLYGSGQEYDLDGVDEFYQHVLLWDKNAGHLVGGYRFRSNRSWDLQTIEQQSYMEKCYPGIYFELSQGKGFIEFGRAFLNIPYQRNVMAMYLIWSCALTYLSQNFVEHPIILGIPWLRLEDFQETSIAFLIHALSNAHFYEPSIRCQPRFPYRKQHQLTPAIAQLAQEQKSITSIFKMIGEMEGKTCKAPSLLKQYIDVMGGKIRGLSFSYDFNLLEVLISTDLTLVPTDKLEYFIKGAEVAA